MSFAKERSRRQNAGNRMRALLDQEAEVEELFEKESLSDDEEFVTKAEDDVQDTFDSDFDTESSDEERAQDLLAEQEDKAIEKQERQARRPKPIPVVTTRRPPGAPGRRKEPIAPSQPPRERKASRRHDGLRQSSRSTTVQSRLHVEEQIRQYQSRKASIVKRDRPVTKRLTQEELLAEAEVTERENKASLEQWLEKEAEKKDKAKKKDKKGIVGPFVRYTSFTDGNVRPRRRKLILIETDMSSKEQQNGGNVQRDINDPQAIAWHEQHDIETSEMEGRNLVTFVQYPHLMQQQQQQKQQIPSIQGLTDRELDRVDLIPELASWTERQSRPVKPMLCPITGLPARYKDPKTNVPYANLDAYKKIRACLNHEMVWSSRMKVYVGEPTGAVNVPEGWELFMTGEGPPDSSSFKRHRSR